MLKTTVNPVDGLGRHMIKYNNVEYDLTEKYSEIMLNEIFYNIQI